MRLPPRLWLLSSLITFLLVSIACLLLGFSRGLAWAGEWAWTVDWGNGLTLAGGPFAAAVAAEAVQRYKTSGIRQLAQQSLRGGRFLPLMMSAVAAGAIAGWGVAALTVVTITASRSDLDPRHLTDLLLGATAMLAYTAAGMLIAVWTSRALAAPGAFVATFALSSLAASGSFPPLFRVGGSAGTLAGQEISPRFIAWAIAAHLLLVVLAFAVMGALDSVHRLPWSWAVAASTAALLALVGYGIGVPQERLSALQDVEFRCAGARVQTCMAADTSTQIDTLSRAMDTYAGALTDLGLTIPERYVQDLPGVRPNASEGVLLLPAQEINTGARFGIQASQSIVIPAGCPQYFGDRPPEEALQAQAIMAAYLRYRVDPRGNPPPPGSREERWMQGPAEGWLILNFPRLKACDLDAVSIPDL